MANRIPFGKEGGIVKIVVQILTVSSVESVVRFRGWLVGLTGVSQVTTNIKEGNGEIISLSLNPKKISFDDFREMTFGEATKREIEISIVKEAN